MGRPRKTQLEEQVRLDTDALDLRNEGKTLRQIADAQGCHWTTAGDRIQRALDRIPAKAVAQRRAKAEAELDFYEDAALSVLTRRHVTVSHGKLVYDPDTDRPLEDDGPVLQAIQVLLRVQERRAKMLGLDAPTRSSITTVTEDVTDAAIRQLEAELAESDRGLRSTAGEDQATR